MSLTGKQKVACSIATGIVVIMAVFVWQVLAETKTKLSAQDKMSNFELGQYYFNHGDHADGVYDLEKARHHYVQILLEDPKANALVWYQLGRVDFIQGRFNAALYKFDKQIEYFGDQVPNVYYMIGLTYGYRARITGSDEDWQRGAEGFQTFLEYEPQSPWARTDVAWIYFAQGKYADMVPVLEEGLVYYPEHAWLLNMYGLALLNTEETAAAREQFLKAQQVAANLTTHDWGKAYPGNNPTDWARGLREFQGAIEKNIALTQ